MKLFNPFNRLFSTRVPVEDSPLPDDDDLESLADNCPQTVTRHPQSTPTRYATQRLSPSHSPDHIGLVGFHDYGFIIAKPADPFAPWLLERNQWLQYQLGGNSNLADGLRQALHLLATTPHGITRKIWLFSDGEPNIELHAIAPVMEACQQSRITINTVGVGYYFNEALLRWIADATCRGRFISVQGLQEMTDALAYPGAIPECGPPQRSETAILVIDCSDSMAEPLEGQTKIEVVQEAILHLLHYKQQLYS